MPITENSFSAEELQAAIEQNPELINTVKTTLSGKKFIIQDESEHDVFKQNYAQSITRDLTKQHAEKLEADVLELTGIVKKPDEKYYEYLKRATKEALGDRESMKNELTLLKEKGNPNVADKARIEQLEKAIIERNNEIEQLKTNSKKEVTEVKAMASIENAISSFKSQYKKGMPESLVSLAEKNALNNLKAMAQVDDNGNVIFVDKDGKPMVDDKTFKPLSAKDLLANELKDLIETGRKGAGTGSGDDDQNDPNKGKGKFTQLPSEVKTRVQLTDYLLTLGYVKGSTEFDAVLEANKNLPLR
mgnify:CR=1 FL=1